MIGRMLGYSDRIMRHLSSGISASVSRRPKNYEEAVQALNTLQSNAVTVERIKKEKDSQCHLKLPETVRDAQRAGVPLELIDKLSIIHVSGTKGKGSTCAFTESILRHHGYKTGFFSSPHLVEVRERIRIDGKPISRHAFSTYFWDCYERLLETKDEYEGSMPPYFRFLTIMAFHAFIQEKVDVAIMEVGIGGQYDCTNIISSPVVCGVTSLGLDHTSMLGDTLEKIAWHKAGIFKPGVPAVTVSQPDGCLEVMKDRAAEIGNPLYLAPSYNSYDWGEAGVSRLGIAGEMQRVNASLALQLCHVWLHNHALERNERLALHSRTPDQTLTSIKDAEIFKVTDQAREGLASCRWAGRNQIVKQPGVTYYVDGAHTPGSVEQCVSWFLPEAKKEASQKQSVAKVLMFNLTGDRDPEVLLRRLVECEFDAAVFCPNIASVSIATDRADQHNLKVTTDTQLSRCVHNHQTWAKLVQEYRERKLNGTSAMDTETHPDKSTKPMDSPQEMSIDSADSDQLINDSDRLTAIQNNNNNSVKLNSRVKVAKLEQENTQNTLSSDNLEEQNAQNTLSTEQEQISDSECFVLCSTIEEAVHWITGEKEAGLNKAWAESKSLSPSPKVLRDVEHVQVLCVGSLHLVGGLMGLLRPDLHES